MEVPRNRIGRYFEDLWIEQMLTVKKQRGIFDRMTAEDHEKLKSIIADEVSAKVDARTRRLSAEVETLRKKDAARDAAVQQLRVSLKSAVAREISRRMPTAETLAESVRDLETQDQERSDAVSREAFEPEVEERSESEGHEPIKPKGDNTNLWDMVGGPGVAAAILTALVIFLKLLLIWLPQNDAKRPAYRPRVVSKARYDAIPPRVTIPDPKPPHHQLSGDASLLIP